MQENRQIILNQIETPDGTVLISRHRHDYVTHKDADGRTYMVDGGRAYLRRNTGPYREQSVYLSDDHDVNRDHFHWGTRGPEGDQPLRYVLLKEMDTDHILAILETQQHIVGSYVEGLMTKELEWRDSVDLDEAV